MSILKAGCAQENKKASYLYRAAQPSILAIFLSWGISTGAGRIRLAGGKGILFLFNYKMFLLLKKGLY